MGINRRFSESPNSKTTKIKEHKANDQIRSMMNALHELSGTVKDPFDFIIYGMVKFGKKSFIAIKLKAFLKFLPLPMPYELKCSHYRRGRIREMQL